MTSPCLRAHAAVDANFADPEVFNQVNTRFQRIADVQIFVVNGGTLFSPTTKVNALTRPFKSYREIAVSIGEAQQSMRTVDVKGTPYRVVAVQAGPGVALVVAQSMESVRGALDRLQVILLLTSSAGVVAAGLSGWAVAANGLRPVRG